MIRKLFRCKKGQGLVEYSLLLAGVALVSAAAVAIFGSKTSDLISATAAVLPGAHVVDNQPMISGQLIETTLQENEAGDDGIQIDTDEILASRNTGRLGDNVLGKDPGQGGETFGGLVLSY
jgi:hypothetical protein